MATPGSLVILVGFRNKNVLHRKSDLISLNVLRVHQFIKTYGSGQNNTNQNDTHTYLCITFLLQVRCDAAPMLQVKIMFVEKGDH